MLKGVFTRKDNGKQLTTTRIVQGDELIQVERIISPLIRFRSSEMIELIILCQQSYSYEGVDAKRIFKRD